MSNIGLSPRQIKALQIAATSKLKRKGKLWIVPSQVGHGEYEVNPEKLNCTCRDHEFTNDRCKHIFAVEYTIP